MQRKKIKIIGIKGNYKRKLLYQNKLNERQSKANLLTIKILRNLQILSFLSI
jgi:hypothetical protein